MLTNLSHLRWFWVLLSTLAISPIALAQKPTPTPKTVDPNLFRWKVALDALEQQSRSVGSEARRPYFIADIASAYWEIDRTEAQTQLNLALDVAWKSVLEDKKNRAGLDYVLSTAAKLDASVLKSLNERLSNKKGAEKEGDSIQGNTFYELLDQDPELAAQMLEAYAPNGLANGMVVSLIVQLAHRDLKLANRVFNTYLQKALANESIPIEGILPLAGFAFGYSESLTIDRRGYGVGSSLAVVDGLAPNATNTNLFLILAYRRLAKAIEQRNNAPGTDAESQSYPILFAFKYLLPEIEKFSPGSLNAWRQLEQEGMAMTTAIQAQKVVDFLAVMIPNRAKMARFKSNPEQPEIDAEARLEDIEKVVGTCQRDVLYTKSAFTFNYRKKFKRAWELVGNIKGEKQLGLATQVVASAQASELIKNGEFDEAEKLIKKIAEPGPKAIANTELAKGAFAQNDAALGDRMIDETVKQAEKLSDANERAGFLFALASIRLRSAPVEARTLLEKAIKELNKQDPADTFKFSIPVRVPQGCKADPPMYWGDLDLPNATILEAIKLFAAENPDATALIVESIGDKPLKVRAEALVIQTALSKFKKAAVAATSTAR